VDPNKEQQQQLIGIAQNIALQALELPPEKRLEFIKRTVTAIRMRYERKRGADPSAAKTADKLQAMTQAVMQILEEDGGQIGHA
jgi:uncharacterized membrane protein